MQYFPARSFSQCGGEWAIDSSFMKVSLCCSRTIATVTHIGIQAVIQLCGYREILHGILRACRIHVALFMNAAFKLLSPHSCCDSNVQRSRDSAQHSLPHVAFMRIHAAFMRKSEKPCRIHAHRCRKATYSSKHDVCVEPCRAFNRNLKCIVCTKCAVVIRSE